jgi:hypothetical protein
MRPGAGALCHRLCSPLLVEQIAFFCRPTAADVPQQLEAVRTAENADIVDALIALAQTRQARHRGQQAAAQHEPAASRDPGWEF